MVKYFYEKVSIYIGRGNVMKKLLGIVVLGLLWCNVGFAVTKEEGPIANFLDTFL